LYRFRQMRRFNNIRTFMVGDSPRQLQDTVKSPRRKI
jgi:hypothetical protein